ncbi:MAG TPA: TIM barrel protein, partial [Acidobacteriota bacterium]|nr:TIM barrel protein [Acidobacteriota bacterium]
MNDLLIGAHMSIAGGLFRALERGESIRCRTIQLFTRNSTRWAARDLQSEEIEAFKEKRMQTGIDPVFAHCSYLINLAAPEFYEASIKALIAEVERAEQLGLDFVVLH